MAFMYGPTQLSMDPESTATVINDSAAEMIRRGTTVAKGSRVYMYVLADSGATLPAKGGLMYILTLATWDPLNGKASVTNGANGLTKANNYGVAVGIIGALAPTAGDFTFIQQRGRAINKILSSSGTGVGTLLVANLVNATNPERAIAATTTNIVLTNHVGYALGDVATNAQDADLCFDIC